MPEIILATLNARHSHTGFGLRYLMANLGELRERSAIREFTISRPALEIVDELLSERPRILGLGVYIWNARQSLQLVRLLKRLRPELVIVLGGPEVSHESDQQEIVELADHLICGEADLRFPELCRTLLDGTVRPAKLLYGGLPDVTQLALPYELYSDNDIARRVVYVEASRGCPFKCEFCLSSLDRGVRKIPLDRFLPALERLFDRGARRFKFIDRTFNLSIPHSRAILEFFLQRYEPGLFVHFEMVPDRLPEELRDVIVRFPEGALQFEVGIQTFNPQVAANISRRQDYQKLDQNLRFLREQSGVHLHTDLIIGLPGEDESSFAAGFDQLVGMRPQEIQVGILKRLRGTPIARHTEQWGMIYNPEPPYDILENRLLPFETLQRMRRFARFFDLVANSGNFVEATALVWQGNSPYAGFMEFSQWLFIKLERTHRIALHKLSQALFEFLTQHRGLDPEPTAYALLRDYRRDGRVDFPAYLRKWIPTLKLSNKTSRNDAPERQRRHLRDPSEA